MAAAAAGAALALTTGGTTLIVPAASATMVAASAAGAGLLSISAKYAGNIADNALSHSKADLERPGKVNGGTGNWNKGSFDLAEDSLNKHFKKHGKEVAVKTPEEYLRKAEEFARTAKKGSTKSPISGEVEGVIRYKKNGKYIDLAPDGSIISFGKQ